MMIFATLRPVAAKTAIILCEPIVGRLCQTPANELAFHRNALQLPGDHEHDLALRRMGLVMCQEFAGRSAPKLLEFFC